MQKEKSKHLFSMKFSKVEFELLDRFSQIENKTKASIIHEALMDYYTKSKNSSTNK